MSKRCKGRVLFRRYADDSVVCFEREDDARAYLRVLPKRLEKFGLSLAAEKSALVRFDRRAPEKSGKFTFLGFDFHWARARANRGWVFAKRRTNKEKFRSSLRAMKEWLRKVHRLLYKWLNRRSQRRSMTWTQFGRRLPGWDLPPPRVVEVSPTPVLRRTTGPA